MNNNYHFGNNIFIFDLVEDDFESALILTA